MLEDFVPWNNLQLSSVIDIACTKLVTISARGSKKDFIDIHRLLESYTIQYLFEKLEIKYTQVHYNRIHILKSLIYFEAANVQPMPRMHTDVVWEDVKKDIQEKVRSVVL